MTFANQFRRPQFMPGCSPQPRYDCRASIWRHQLGFEPDSFAGAYSSPRAHINSRLRRSNAASVIHRASIGFRVVGSSGARPALAGDDVARPWKSWLNHLGRPDAGSTIFDDHLSALALLTIQPI